MHRRKRQRLARSGSDGPLEATSGIPIWLDNLPHEICERIATHVCRRQQNLDALALANTSSVMRKAVLAVRHRRLSIRDRRWISSPVFFPKEPKGGNLDMKTLRQWIVTMGDDVFEMDQLYLANFMRKRLPRFILPVLALPNLRAVHIVDHPAQLAAISSSASVRDILLQVRGCVTPKDLFRAFSKIKLTKLIVVCDHITGGQFPCPFEDLDATGLNTDTVRKSLQHLKSLLVRCPSNYHACSSKIWKVVPSLETIRDITFSWNRLSTAFPEHAVKFLSKRDSVGISNTDDSCNLAARIGTSVTEISTDLHVEMIPYSADELLRLRQHPRLKVLRVKLKSGTDAVLPQTVRRLPELKELEVFWDNSELIGREPCKYSGLLFASASPGVMLRTVKAAPRLSCLCLGLVRIALSEVIDILRCVGSRLRVFQTFVSDQEEAPFERLEALLLAAAEHNDELKEFSVSDVNHWRGPIPVHEWKQQCKRVLRSLQFLEKRAASLWAGKLMADIRTMGFVLGGA